MAIQRVNIEKILHENLPKEIELLTEEISNLQQSLLKLQSRRNLLLNIAEVAGVDLTEYLRDGEAGRNRDESNLRIILDSNNNHAPIRKEVDATTTTIRRGNGEVVGEREERSVGVGFV